MASFCRTHPTQNYNHKPTQSYNFQCLKHLDALENDQIGAPFLASATSDIHLQTSVHNCSARRRRQQAELWMTSVYARPHTSNMIRQEQKLDTWVVAGLDLQQHQNIPIHSEHHTNPLRTSSKHLRFTHNVATKICSRHRQNIISLSLMECNVRG